MDNWKKPNWNQNAEKRFTTLYKNNA
jgi:hypothetical protein